MIKRAAWCGAALLAGTLALTGCGSSSSPSSNAQASSAPALASVTPTPAAAASSPAVGTNAGSDFCTSLKQAHSDMSQMTANMAKSMAGGSFATREQNLSAFMQAVITELAKVESTMTNAPANVQAALTVVNQWYAQATTVVTQSKSSTQLVLALATLGRNTTGLRAASDTLTAYGKAQCGNLFSS